MGVRAPRIFSTLASHRYGLQHVPPYTSPHAPQSCPNSIRHLRNLNTPTFVKAINEIKPFYVRRSKGPARLKIHNNAVRALRQNLRCIQHGMPIPKTLLHLPVYSKIKNPTAATVKKTLRKLQHRLNIKAEKRATIRTRMYKYNRTEFFSNRDYGLFLNSALNRFSNFNGIEGFHTSTQDGQSAVDMDPTRTKDMTSARIQAQHFTASTPTPAFYSNRTLHNYLNVTPLTDTELATLDNKMAQLWKRSIGTIPGACQILALKSLPPQS